MVKTIMKILYLLLLAVTLAYSLTFSQNYVAGYYPNWLLGTLPPQNIKYENLTHVIHAFAWPTSSGSIEMYSGMPSSQLIQSVHNAGKKIVLAFGGWGQSAGFAPMAADSTARANFINNVVQLFHQHGYDGIDLDWEYPSNVTEGKNLTKLVKELRERFYIENPEWTISMAVGAGSWSGQYIEYQILKDYVEWIGVMTYDFHGSWTSHAGHNSPLYHPSNCPDGSCDSGVKYLINTRQVPKNKVLMGIPFYGREFNASGLYQPRTGNTADLSYNATLTRINSGTWEYYWDDFSRVPYLLNNEHTKFVTYESPQSIVEKCSYALSNGLKGVMMWALGQDVVGGDQPLLEAVGRGMGLVTSVETSEQTVLDFYLFENYPNPFNPSTNIKFLVPETSFVTLTVYDVLGREVAVLVNEIKPAGTYEVTFDATSLSSGVYTYVLSSENFFQSKKMLLLK